MAFDCWRLFSYTLVKTYYVTLSNFFLKVLWMKWCVVTVMLLLYFCISWLNKVRAAHLHFNLILSFWPFYMSTHSCRLFNLASDPLQPEQEYYLQPVDPGSSRSASSMCPADFSFGGDHLWDRFSVSLVTILIAWNSFSWILFIFTISSKLQFIYGRMCKSNTKLCPEERL